MRIVIVIIISWAVLITVKCDSPAKKKTDTVVIFIDCLSCIRHNIYAYMA